MDFNRFYCVCREILNEERCPGFLLEAVRSAIKTKRRLIKAKMLGIPASECNSRSDSCFAPHLSGLSAGTCSESQEFLRVSVSSDDEDGSSRFGRTEVDGAAVDEVDRPTESRIRNL